MKIFNIFMIVCTVIKYYNPDLLILSALRKKLIWKSRNKLQNASLFVNFSFSLIGDNNSHHGASSTLCSHRSRLGPRAEVGIDRKASAKTHSSSKIKPQVQNDTMVNSVLTLALCVACAGNAPGADNSLCGCGGFQITYCFL